MKGYIYIILINKFNYCAFVTSNLRRHVYVHKRIRDGAGSIDLHNELVLRNGHGYRSLELASL